MALETLTFDFHATFFPLGPDFIAAFEYSSLDSPAGYTTSESLSVAKKAVEDDDDEFEDDDDEEDDDEEEDDDDEDEFEDDDDEVDEDDDDDDEYEDDEDEDDDDEDEDDDDVDELQVGRRF
jgi:pyruvate/2-oxoacid:ferredoxin oxidoreductase beta subunit